MKRTYLQQSFFIAVADAWKGRFMDAGHNITDISNNLKGLPRRQVFSTSLLNSFDFFDSTCDRIDIFDCPS
jgi:hypothetical protein